MRKELGAREDWGGILARQLRLESLEGLLGKVPGTDMQLEPKQGWQWIVARVPREPTCMHLGPAPHLFFLWQQSALCIRQCLNVGGQEGLHCGRSASRPQVSYRLGAALAADRCWPCCGGGTGGQRAAGGNRRSRAADRRGIVSIGLTSAWQAPSQRPWLQRRHSEFEQCPGVEHAAVNLQIK